MKRTKAEILEMDDSKEMSDILVGSDFSLDDIFSGLKKVSGLTGSKQKEAAIQNLKNIEEKIKQVSFDTLQMELKKKEADNKLAQNEFYKAYTKLKKDISGNKKLLKVYSAFFAGKLDLLKDMGINLSEKDLKNLKKIIDVSKAA